MGNEFANLEGLQAVVTGSSSGIGKAIAIELARAGADIFLHCCHSVEKASAVSEEISQLGRKAEVIPCDFSKVDELESFVDQVWSKAGSIPLWVNNAGVDLLTTPDHSSSYEQKLQKLLDVDVRSTLLLSRYVAKRMSERSGGSILNIGWDQADRGMEGESGELFSAAKNAIMGATKSLAKSYAPSVRINCIAPGWIKTYWGEKAGDYWQERVLDETPLNRWGLPEDIAKMARFLLSQDASFITGQVINVNGGAYC